MKYILQITLLSSFLFNSVIQSWAQSTFLQKYSMVQNHAVNDISIDTDQRVWVATEKGLVRIDKDRKAQLFDPSTQSPTYNESNVSCIQWAKNKTIWLGTYNSAILRMDTTGKFSYFDFSNLGHFLVTSMTEDLDGKIWAGTSGKGIFTVDVLNGKTYYSTENSKILSDRVFAIHADRFGNKWVGTSKGLCRIQNNKKWNQYGIDGQITAIKEFQSSLWVIAVNDQGSELWKYDHFRKWIKVPVPKILQKTRIMDFDVDTYGRFAFVSNKIVIVDGKDEQIYHQDNGFSSNSGLCIKIDPKGIVWIGTEGKGLFHTLLKSMPDKEPTNDELFTTESIDKFMETPVPLQIEFNRGSAELLITSEPELERVARLLRKFPNLKLRLAGHTDNVGNANRNLKLSEQRATAVKGYLVQRKGIQMKRISCIGYGGQRPVADNSTEATRKKNRRVEMILFE